LKGDEVSALFLLLFLRLVLRRFMATLASEPVMMMMMIRKGFPSSYFFLLPDNWIIFIFPMEQQQSVCLLRVDYAT